MTLVRERHHSFSIPSISILWSRANFITLMIGISLMIGLFATSTAQAQVYAGSWQLCGPRVRRGLQAGSRGQVQGPTCIREYSERRRLALRGADHGQIGQPLRHNQRGWHDWGRNRVQSLSNGQGDGAALLRWKRRGSSLRGAASGHEGQPVQHDESRRHVRFRRCIQVEYVRRGDCALQLQLL